MVVSLFPNASRNVKGKLAASKGSSASFETASSISTAFISELVKPLSYRASRVKPRRDFWPHLNAAALVEQRSDLLAREFLRGRHYGARRIAETGTNLKEELRRKN
jgi:hypothetical protein